jgi:hypothetical protein
VRGTPSKAPAPRAGGVPERSVTVVRALQPAKAEPPMAVMEEGKETEERRVQLAKAEAPIKLREEGKVTEAREVQLAKAEAPMAVMVWSAPR